jgi:hypothetical protein
MEEGGVGAVVAPDDVLLGGVIWDVVGVGLAGGVVTVVVEVVEVEVEVDDGVVVGLDAIVPVEDEDRLEVVAPVLLGGVLGTGAGSTKV